MKQLFLIIAIGCFNQTNGQELSREFITGDWICTEVALVGLDRMPDQEKELAEKVKTEFVNAVFTFGADSIFQVKFAATQQPGLMDGLKFLNNKKWFYDPVEGLISLGNPEENLAQFYVKQRGPNIGFVIHETPFLLIMKKK